MANGNDADWHVLIRHADYRFQVLQPIDTDEATRHSFVESGPMISIQVAPMSTHQ